MDKKQIQDIRILAESMDWDDLVEMIIDIEKELSEIKQKISGKELKDREKELQIYENTKKKMVKSLTKKRPYMKHIYGVDYISAGDYEEDIY